MSDNNSNSATTSTSIPPRWSGKILAALDIVRDQIKSGDYKTSLSLRTHAGRTDRDAREAKFKADVIAALGLNDHPAASMAFDLAYKNNHGSGQEDVLSAFEDIAEVLNLANPNNARVTKLNVFSVVNIIPCTDGKEILNIDSRHPIEAYTTYDMACKHSKEINKGRPAALPETTVDNGSEAIVYYNGKHYLLGLEVLDNYFTPEEEQAAILAKIQAAGITSAELSKVLKGSAVFNVAT